MAKARIAALYTKPETVLEDYRRLFELAGADRALDRDATTILKDNISWHFPMPAANTTPWQLEATILALKQMGYEDQVCVQNETVVINAFKGEDLNLFRPIFDAYGIPVLYNFREEDITWVPYEPKGEMLALDRIMEGVGIHIPEYFIGKNIVHLPTFKCHIYTTTTGAMKNAFGGLLNTRRHYTHTWIHETLVDLLTIQKEIHAGIFCAMDGTTAGNGEGPRTHMPEVKNVILAGADQVACDAVSAKMMGFDPLSIDYIRLAHEKGLGVGDPAEIEIVGDDVSGENWHFSVGYNFHRFLAWLGWYGPTKFLQKLIFRTRIVKIPIFVSEFNHDYVQWPLKYEKLYKKWRAETPWGRLFERYEKEKALGKGYNPGPERK
ncbi:MAG TPA: DUF362 domain-containing protein [bacterium]|nr:DUF362 domain-containing protein [bacterium]